MKASIIVIAAIASMSLLAGCLEGPAGPAGKDGVDGNVVIDGDSMVCAQDPDSYVTKCVKVVQGANGAKGDKGDRGDSGSQGLPGATGLPGGNSYSDDINNMTSSVMSKSTGVLMIDVYRSNGQSHSLVWSGSGTLTTINGQNYILTARHVVSDDFAYNKSSFADRFNLYNDGRYVGTISNSTGDKIFETPMMMNRDIALIKCDSYVNISSIQMKTDYVPRVGDLTMTVAYPGALVMGKQYTTGLITDDNADEDITRMNSQWSGSFTTDASVTHGSSGGPVFNRNGEFIGIEVGGFITDWPNNLNISVQLLFR